MPPQPKKLCVNANISSSQGSSSRLQHNIDTILSQDILSDHAKVLFLFQCFQEAEDKQLSKDLLQRIYEKRHVNLKNQVLNSCHIVSLGFFLSKPSYKWKCINLVKCNLGKRGTYLLHQLHQYFNVRSSDKSTVDEINLSSNLLSHYASPLLADVISCLRPDTLHLCDNFLALKGIATIMAKISTVKQLYVESNYITNLNREVVSNMLRSLTKLYIGKNQLGNEGAKLLSEGLLNVSSLQILNVQNSRITCEGAKALANALKWNKSLRILDLSSNNIGDDGAMAFADILARINSTLVGLLVPRNNIDSSGVTALKHMVKTKATPFKLVISNKENWS